MPITWLHVSDFHFREGDSYDRDTVLNALITSVRSLRENASYRPDLIFATGDIGQSGKAREYEPATSFFDALLHTTGLDRSRLFVVPGNHDVDRDAGKRLQQSLADRGDADEYFAPDAEILHIRKLQAYADWHDSYFKGLRTFPRNATCHGVDVVDIHGSKLAILSINSALFCQRDKGADHGQLWVGRRPLEGALHRIKTLSADVNIALLHHPIDWLHDEERSNIDAMLADAMHVVLRGHLHDAAAVSNAGIGGDVIHLAAGATYQTRKYPNIALYGTVAGGNLTVSPIHYCDSPIPAWVPHNGLFAREPGYVKRISLPIKGPRPPAPALTSPSYKQLRSETAGERNADERFNRLKQMVADELQKSAAVMTLLEQPLSSPASVGSERATLLVDALMAAPFDEGKAILLAAWPALGKQSDRAVIKRISRLLLPFLFVAGAGMDASPWRKVTLGQIMGVPAGIRTIAEMVMAGLYHREVAWAKVEGLRSFPDGEYCTSFQPEGGIDAVLLTSLRDDLYRIVRPAGRDPQRLSAEIKDQSINQGLEYWLNQQGIRIYLILEPPGVSGDQAAYDRQISDVQDTYPLLAILRLDEELMLDHERLFDEIRPLMV